MLAQVGKHVSHVGHVGQSDGQVEQVGQVPQSVLHVSQVLRQVWSIFVGQRVSDPSTSSRTDASGEELKDTSRSNSSSH